MVELKYTYVCDFCKEDFAHDIYGLVVNMPLPIPNQKNYFNRALFCDDCLSKAAKGMSAGLLAPSYEAS